MKWGMSNKEFFEETNELFRPRCRCQKYWEEFGGSKHLTDCKVGFLELLKKEKDPDKRVAMIKTYKRHFEE